MAKTVDNLLQAFQGCSEASVRYLAFAQAADEEGHAGAAKALRAVAKAKMFHALSHYRAANALDTTVENLKQCLEEETYDYKSQYPRMIEDAVADDALEARHSLEYGMSIGPVLTRWITKAMADPGVDPGGSFYVCPVCGNVEFGKPPAKCPFCGVDASRFVEVS